MVVFDFLAKLDVVKIYYSLSSPTDRAIMVNIAVPGERWEVEFHEDGEVSVEVFKSEGVGGGEHLNDLFLRFSDESPLVLRTYIEDRRRTDVFVSIWTNSRRWRLETTTSRRAYCRPRSKSG